MSNSSLEPRTMCHINIVSRVSLNCSYKLLINALLNHTEGVVKQIIKSKKYYINLKQTSTRMELIVARKVKQCLYLSEVSGREVLQWLGKCFKKLDKCSTRSLNSKKLYTYRLRSILHFQVFSTQSYLKSTDFFKISIIVRGSSFLSHWKLCQNTLSMADCSRLVRRRAWCDHIFLALSLVKQLFSFKSIVLKVNYSLHLTELLCFNIKYFLIGIQLSLYVKVFWYDES